MNEWNLNQKESRDEKAEFEPQARPSSRRVSVCPTCGRPFVRVANEMPHVKDVAGSNYAFISGVANGTIVPTRMVTTIGNRMRVRRLIVRWLYGIRMRRSSRPRH